MTELLCETVDDACLVVRPVEYARFTTTLKERGGAIVAPRESVGPGIGTSSLVARYLRQHQDRYREVVRLRGRTEVQWQSDLVRACAAWNVREQSAQRANAPALALRHALHTRTDGLLLWLDDGADLQRAAPFIEEWEALRQEGKPFDLVISSSDSTLEVTPCLERISLGGLKPADALRWCLLHTRREAMQSADYEAAGVVCEYLGFHPLAVRLVALAGCESRRSFTEMLTMLRESMSAAQVPPIEAAVRTAIQLLRACSPQSLPSLARLNCLPATSPPVSLSRDHFLTFDESHLATLRDWGFVMDANIPPRIACESLRAAINRALTVDERETAVAELTGWGEAVLADATANDSSTKQDLERLELTWPLVESASSLTGTATSRKLLELAVDPIARVGACEAAAGVISKLLETSVSGDQTGSQNRFIHWLERRGEIRLQQQDLLQARQDFRSCHELLHAAHLAVSETGLRITLSIVETDLSEGRLQRAATRLVAAGSLIRTLRTRGAERIRFLMLRGVFHLQAGKTESALVLLERAAQAVQRLPDDAPLKYRIQILLARATFSRGKSADAERVLREVIDAQTRDSHITPLDVVVPRLMLADLLLSAGRFAEAVPLFRQVFEARQHSVGRLHRLTGEAANRLAVALAQAGDFRAADELFRESLAILEQVLSGEHPEVAGVLNDYAKAQFSQGKYDAAKQMCERALDIQEQSLSGSDQRIARTRNNLAALYVAQGAYERAEDLYRRDLEVKQARYSPQHPLVAVALNNLGSVCQSLMRFDEANEYLEEALRIRRHHCAHAHPDVAQSLNNLGYLRLRQRRYREALELLQESRRMREAILNASHPHLAATCEAIGEALFRQGEWDQSLAHFERALTICEEVYGERHQRYAHVLSQLGRVEVRLKKHARAELHLRKAEQLLLQSVGLSHAYYAHVLCGLAELEEAGRQHEAACALLSRARDIFQAAKGGELDAADVLLASGRIMLKCRAIGDAVEHLLECVELRMCVLGRDHLETAQARLALATAYVATSNVDRATEHLDAAIEVFERHGDAARDWHAQAIARKVDVAVARSKLTDAEVLLSNRLQSQSLEQPAPTMERVALLGRLAGVHLLREDHVAAVPFLKESLALVERQRGRHHPDLVPHIDVLVGVHIHLGELVEAESLIQRAIDIIEREYGESHPAVIELLQNYASLLAKCHHGHEAAAVRTRVSRLQHRLSHVLDEIL